MDEITQNARKSNSFIKKPYPHGLSFHPKHTGSDGLFNVVFNEVSNPIILLSIDHEKMIPIINDINHCFGSITGYAFDDVNNKPLFDYIYETPEKSVIRDALLERKSAIINCQFICTDKQHLNVNLTVRPYTGDPASSRFICILRIDNDYVKIKNEAAREVKANLLAAMHHNFRTPLNGILGYSEVIMSEMLGPIGKSTYREYASDIHGAGQELLQLIDSLLELKELETSEFELHEENIDLIVLLKKCVQNFNNEAIKQNILLELVYPFDFPIIKCDALRIQKSIESVIDNALKFTTSEVKIVLRLSIDNLGNCIISCIDNGKGMHAQEVAQAFSHDTHLDNIYSDPGTGIGFGITYVKKIIENHGGSVSIISAPNSGTKMNLILPAQRIVTMQRSH
jgi:two-component system, cell cycle sensor histidine kinase PleC